MRSDPLEQLEYELEAEFEALGESEWEDEFEDPPWPSWPTGRTFDPGPPTLIPASPVPTSPRLPCEGLRRDADALSRLLSGLNESVALLDQMASVKPRDQQAWDLIKGRALKQEATLARAMQAMIGSLRDGSYKADGCTAGPTGRFARVTKTVRKLRLQGGWERIPYVRDPATGDYVENLRRLRDILVYLLRQSR
jgi:hypothetical protein